MNLRAVTAFIIGIIATTGAIAQINDGCPEGFAGSDRDAIKNRTPDAGFQYGRVNGGNPINASKWFGQTCEWDTQLDSLRPWKKAQFKTKLVDDVENLRVTLRGYLVSVKKDADNDFHVEIAESPNWSSRHMIAEFPSLAFACDARKTINDLVQNDTDAHRSGSSSSKHAFYQAVCIEVEGFVFLGMHHSKTGEADCKTSGGRGLHANGQPSEVVGLYEIHPAFSLKKLNSSQCKSN